MDETRQADDDELLAALADEALGPRPGPYGGKHLILVVLATASVVLMVWLLVGW